MQVYIGSLDSVLNSLWKSKSTVTNLFMNYTDLVSIVKAGYRIYAELCELFYTVDHYILVSKPKSMGIDKLSLLSWFRSFLV